MNNNVGITDIAARLGVSAATISRAINNKDGVSDATREKVLDELKKMRYRVNASARNLKNNEKRSIGILFRRVMPGDIIYEISYKKILGLSDVIKSHGYDIMLFRDDDIDEMKRFIVEKDIIGVASLYFTGTEYLELYEHYKLPHVAINWKTYPVKDSLIHVCTDMELTLRKALDYAKEKKYKKIGILSWHDKITTTNTYRDMCKKVFPEYGLDYDKTVWSVDYEIPKEEIYDYLKNTACDFYVSYYYAYTFWIMDYAAENNLKIPEDFGLIGYDYQDVFKYISPRIPWIKQDTYNISVKGAEKLIRIINGFEERSEDIPPIFIPAERN